MAIAFRAGTSSDVDTTIAKPSGTADGDILVLVVTLQDDFGVDFTPAGWTQRLRAQQSLINVITSFVFTKIAGPSEPSSYTVDPGTGDVQFNSLAAYSGGDTSAPYGAGGSAHGNGTSAVAPSVTATSTGALVVAACCYSSFWSATPPTGMTERITHLEPQAMWDQAISAGATGTRTAGLNASDNWNVFALALNAAATTPITCAMTGAGALAVSMRACATFGVALSGAGALACTVVNGATPGGGLTGMCLGVGLGVGLCAR